MSCNKLFNYIFQEYVVFVENVVNFDESGNFTTFIDKIKNVQKINSDLLKFKDTVYSLNDAGMLKGTALTGLLHKYEDLDDEIKNSVKLFAQGKISSDELSASFDSASKSTAKFHNALKSFAVNAVIMVGINLLIKGIQEIATVSEQTAQKAQEIGEAFKSTKTDIEGYKTQIEELYTIINDSGSSITEVTTARKNLMSVQDELIEKFGDEEGAINNITNAINGQVDALDELTQKEWQEKKSEFNGGFWQQVKNSIYSIWDGNKTNIDRMLDTMENGFGEHAGQAYVNIKGLRDNGLIDILKNMGYEYISASDSLNIYGDNLKDVYDQLIKIQTITEEYSDKNELVFNDNFSQFLNSEINKAKDNLDKYSETYKQYVLYEEVLPDDKNSDYYSQLTEAYQAYYDARTSGDEEATTKAKENYAKIMDTILDSNASDRVKEFFKDLYPDLQEEVEQWEFKTQVIPKFDTKGLQGKTQADVLEMLQTKGVQEGEKTFNSIVEKAIEYGLIIDDDKDSIQQLLDLLVEWGILQGTISDTAEEANKIDVSSILSGVQSLSDGLDQLDKIYADVKDGEYFDFSSILNNKEFTEAFGDLGESYENFIETITNSPSDIKACQSAFNDLATAYINNSSALENVTEETKNSTIAMLKQMGVANAEEIVLSSLNAQKEASVEVGKDFVDITEEEIDALIAEGNVSAATCQYLSQLRLAKLDVNKLQLDTKSDVNNILAIANAAGASVAQIYTLKIALENLQSTKSASLNALKKGVSIYNSSLQNQEALKQNKVSFEDQLKQAQKEVQGVLNSIQNSAKLNASDFYADYTGGSKSNGDSGGSQSEKEFNWIETLLSRIQNKISDLGKTASATWKSWTERNSALKDQMSAVSQEISLQQQAISKYESLAGSLGLSSYYQNLVKNGALDISTITDDNLADKISKYQEYWEKIVSAEDAIQDLEDELRNLARTEFDNVAKQFDSEISLVEANISTLEAYIDQTEMKGNLVSKNYYSAMYAEEQKNLGYLQQKYDQLSNKLSNGTIVQGSEEFNEMATEIKEVSKAIIESTTALEEYQKTMRELDWQVFDLIEEKIGNVTEESEFLIDLLSNSKLFNDDGSITSQGQATLGLHVANMKVYENQVKDYADELAKLDAQFANDSLDKNYLERREELLALQRDSILAMKSEQQSIQDLWSEGYSKLLDYMQEVSDKYRDMMSEISDTRDFEKSVKSQVEEISRLQNILDSYRNDTSEEGKLAKQQIGEQLKEARETLEETEREQYLKELDAMLTAMMDDASEWQNARLDDVSGLIQSVVDGVDENASSIENTLKTEISAVGGSLTTEMQSLWSGSDGIKGVVGGVNDTLLDIKALVQSMVKGSDTEASKNASDATTSVTPTTTPVTTPSTSNSSNNSSTSAKAITVGGMIDASGALIYDYAGDTSGERQYYRNSPYYRVLGEKNGYLKVRHQSLSSGTTGWFKKSDVKAYKTGGLVDETGLAWLDGTKSKPELVLNSEQTENHLKLTKALETVAKTNMFDAIQSYAKLPQFTTNSSGNKSVEIHFENMTFPYVKNADDFITDLQHSKRFENVVLAITDGKGNLDKYKY